MAWVALVVHAGLVLAAAPVLAGMMGVVAARWRGGDAGRVEQAWRDLVRLWRKAAVVPAGASFVVSAAPVAALGTAVAAALLIPSFASGMGLAGVADLVVIAGLLLASRGVVAFAAWDSGSAVVAHAGARGLLARVGSAPVLMLVAFAGLLLSGGTNVDAMAGAVRDGGVTARLGGGLAGLALFGVAVTEGGGAAAFSGRRRAMVVLALHVRVVVVLTLAGAVGAPFGLAAAGAGVDAWVVGVACWALKLLALGGVAACLGAPRLALVAAALLALLAVVVSGLQGAV